MVSIRWPTLAVLAFACGCSSSPDEPMAPVSGQVTIEGRPLTTGCVQFRPDPARGNLSRHHPTATIEANGTYRLQTIGQARAPLGCYKVLVFAGQLAPGQTAASPGQPIWLVPARYTEEQTTDLAIEIVARPVAGAYDLRLKE